MVKLVLALFLLFNQIRYNFINQMTKECFFYLPDSALNDATIFYCNLVRKACEYLDINVIDITEKEFCRVERGALTFTIRLTDYFKIAKYSRHNMFWFQGIVPEEILLLKGKGLKNRFMYFYVSIKERKVLKTALLNMFVSEAMRKHYLTKYRINQLDNNVVVPCYNQKLHYDVHQIKERFNNLAFVYAGSMSAWQCIEESLQIFKEVQLQEPSATFTILTNQKDKISGLIKKHRVSNVFTDYVALSDLQEYLSKFKYAFLLRRKDVVNEVSTPTKMNSYLASGLIPIYTDVVSSFEENIDLNGYGIKVSLESDRFDTIAKRILSHHSMKININGFVECLERLFSDYYNDATYINQLALQIEKQWLQK